MLYHGSKIKGLKILTPFPHNGVNGESVVFASTDIRFALAMIHGTGDELAVGYFVNQETHHEHMYIDELVPHAFELLKAPGTLYELEDSGFIGDSQLSHVELISKKETKVISEKYIENIFDALKKFDISFVNYEEVLDAMKLRKKDPQGPQNKYKQNRFQ